MPRCLLSHPPGPTIIHSRSLTLLGICPRPSLLRCWVCQVGRTGGGNPGTGPGQWSLLVKGGWGHEREGAGQGAVTSCCGLEQICPTPSPPGAPTNRPDLRAGGAQDAKHAAKLFNVVLTREEGGPIQQLPHDAAYSPAGTEHRADLMPRDRPPTPAPAPHTRASCPQVQTLNQGPQP